MRISNFVSKIHEVQKSHTISMYCCSLCIPFTKLDTHFGPFLWATVKFFFFLHFNFSRFFSFIISLFSPWLKPWKLTMSLICIFCRLCNSFVSILNTRYDSIELTSFFVQKQTQWILRSFTFFTHVLCCCWLFLSFDFIVLQTQIVCVLFGCCYQKFTGNERRKLVFVKNTSRKWATPIQ